MRYSLLNRCYGVLLGAIIGENIAFRNKDFSENVQVCSKEVSHWSEVATSYTETLIAFSRLETSDRLCKQEQGIQLEDSLSVIPAVLPVVLFFHENSIKLRQNLIALAEFWQTEPIIRDGMLAVGYAIAQSLTEKQTRATLIPQTISFLGETPTRLPQQLLKVKNLLESGAGLDSAQAELTREEKPGNVIAMAFYCFLSTLEDFRLSVLRADRLSRYSKTIGTVTGALSGAYNSNSGIPVTWQISLERSNLAQKWQMANSDNMLRLTNTLMAVWSGVYDIGRDSNEFGEEKSLVGPSFKSSLQAIAAPRVIRLR
ncbi:ADP-ribosylglycohydrolase family protein [Scytonema sp. UIC 10036]|uniref:ADP-ribosylglycohydrolase family protein n=1 Tax=Scytonema sp. UIC 10036 TaxID=2304196 RepID=UPI0012DA6C0A|nr:ADP-ribosylglycohydrolase family protein [Scytonema sp. UIC 10036]MUG95271.1 ADP-ribosylglycohydrolase family protein [Scytonema sp. UIC 10036]